MTQHRIGFDIGGTKITGVLLAPDGRVLIKQRWAVPDDYAGLLALLCEAVAQFDSAAGSKASVGLGIAGIINHQRGVLTMCKLRWLEEQPVVHDLAIRLARPIKVANDADCFVVSEALDGAGASHHHVFGVILGTGVGGGQVVGQELVTGANGVNGEWGHVPLPYYQVDDGALQLCHCGKTGCIEMFLSGGGLARLHQFKHRLAAPVTAAAIAASAEKGDVAALRTLDHYYHLLAKGLSMIVLCFDPDVIVIGGGLRDLPQIYTIVKSYIPLYCFVRDLKTAIVPARYDSDSGVRGAAWLM